MYYLVLGLTISIGDKWQYCGGLYNLKCEVFIRNFTEEAATARAPTTEFQPSDGGSSCYNYVQ